MMRSVLQKEYGFQDIEIKRLDGYDNLNYLIDSNKGRFVFKTYSYEKGLQAIIDAETSCLLFLHKTATDFFPTAIPFSDGGFYKKLLINGDELLCRLLSFVDGESFADAFHTESLFSSLGEFIAKLDLQLQGFNSPAIKARKWEWDIQYMNLNEKYLNDITDEDDRDMLEGVFRLFNLNVLPVLPDLRKQTIHNDANEWNVLVKSGIVSGIIDFGDLAYSPLINELAIAIAYACLGKKNPLFWASIIITAYNGILAIEEREIEILYYLIIARLTVSICNSAHSRKINPDNKYATVSEAAALEILHRWLDINPVEAEKHFKKLIGI